MKALRIVDWQEHYETTESKRTKALSWVATPNGHDSKGFRKLAKRPDFLSVFGVWNVILQQASKCKERGLLVNGKCEPYLAVDFADLTGGTVLEWEKGIAVLISVKWLEELEYDRYIPSVPCKSQGAPANPREPAGAPALQDSTEQNKTGQDRTRSAGTPATPADQDLFNGNPALPSPHDLRVKSLPDLELVCPGIHIGRDERQTWERLLQGYGWDPLQEACAASHDAKSGRIYLSAVKTYLAEHFRIVEEGKPHGR